MRCLSRSLERLRRAEAADVLRRRVGVHLHREQRPADEVALLRLAGPDGDVGLAHGEVELLVVEDQLDADVGVELDELADARRQPDGAEADGRGDAQLAGRLVVVSASSVSAVCSLFMNVVRRADTAVSPCSVSTRPRAWR